MRDEPVVTFIIVARNAAKYLPNLLTDLCEQDYPADLTEVIIVDGMSSDATLEVAIHYSKLLPACCRIISNPGRSLASGWNVGVREATGDVIIRVDAHAKIPKDFISRSVEVLLEHPEAVGVGGRLDTVGVGTWGPLISEVLSSRFGVGNSRFRVSHQSGYVDTIVYGAYHRKVFAVVGGFNESFRRNQDVVFHSKLRQRGLLLWQDNRIRSTYLCRSSILPFIRQGFDNGYWVGRTLIHEPKALSPRHVVPMMFVSVLFASIVAATVSKWAWYGTSSVLIIYFGAAAFSAVRSVPRIGILRAVLLPATYFSLHLSYGIGSLIGSFVSILRVRRSDMGV